MVQQMTPYERKAWERRVELRAFDAELQLTYDIHDTWHELAISSPTFDQRNEASYRLQIAILDAVSGKS